MAATLSLSGLSARFSRLIAGISIGVTESGIGGSVAWCRGIAVGLAVGRGKDRGIAQW